MSTTAARRERPAAPAPGPEAVRRLLRDAFVMATAVEAVAFAILLSGSGSAAGRAARVAAVAVLAVGGMLLARRRGVGRDVAAASFGVLGLVAGAGVGLHRVTVVPAALAVSGLVLLGYGGVRLTRRLPRWWRLMAIPAAMVLLTFVVFPLAVAVFATNVPREAGSSDTPGNHGLSYRDVRLRTSDGASLAAWYVPARNRAAVVLTHGSGSGSTKASVLGQAEVLARHGYGVLLVDARGHGQSTGHAMDFGWYGERDISAAVDFLMRQPEVDRQKVGVVGESMGGEEAIGAAGADRRIAAVVSEGTTGRTAADQDWKPGGVPGALQRGIDFVTYTAAGLLTNAPQPASLRSSISAAAPRPILLIAAGSSADEISAGQYLRAASPATVRLWVVPGARHTGGLSVARAAWTATVTGFLDSALQPVMR